MRIKKTIQKISSSITRIVLVMVVFFAVIALFSAFTSKDKIKIDPEATTKKQRAEIYQIINDPQYQKDDAGKAAIGIYRAMLCGAIGEACTDNPADADVNFNHSLFGFVSNLIVMPYANPPASGVQYMAYSLGNAGLIPKAYAAEGIGFASIKPMIEIWKAFRNVAYLILVLVLIAIGFMIMFRMKLNPQTVISLENSLPKIVVSLIFITFSFAIAGLLIDLMYTGIAVIISLLSTVDIGKFSINNLSSVQNKYIGAGFTDIWPYDPRFPGSAWWDLLTYKSGNSIFGVGNAFIKILPGFLEWPIRVLSIVVGRVYTDYIMRNLTPLITLLNNLFDVPINILGTSIGINLKGIPASITATLIAFFGAFIAVYGPAFLLGLLFFATLFFLLFRIFFMLLTTYLKILILILFAPVVLLFDAIPGKNVFSFWLKSLIGELLTFPLVILFVLVGYMISNIPIINANFFKPPFLTGIDPGAFAAILGMGTFLIIPQMVKLVKELLGIKGLPELKPGFMAGGTVVLGGTMGLLGTFSSLNLGMTGLKNLSQLAGKGLQQIQQRVGQITQRGGGQQTP